VDDEIALRLQVAERVSLPADTDDVPRLRREEFEPDEGLVEVIAALPARAASDRLAPVARRE
jgi:hypothetical protein